MQFDLFSSPGKRFVEVVRCVREYFAGHRMGMIELTSSALHDLKPESRTTGEVLQSTERGCTLSVVRPDLPALLPNLLYQALSSFVKITSSVGIQ